MASHASTGELSATGKRWVLCDCDERRRDELVAALGVSPIVAHLLLNRGVDSTAAARQFLAPDLKDLHEPSLLPDIEKAVERIRRAIGDREKILIYGDYDADGVTATSLLIGLFGQLGVEPAHYIPHRVDEGYGLHAEAIEAAAADGVRLIVTVDCGINAVAEVERARELGVDVVVTDHHEPGRSVPRACAVVNPKLTGCLYPFRGLAGVGVAFKLAWAVGQTFSPAKRVTADFRRFLLDAMGLVALGTVADVVPLTGENRVFATYGLHALRRSTNPGIVALIRQAGVEGKALTPRDVSFKLAPRLNAAGRLGAADVCVELLTTDCPERAAAIAAELDKRNRERQRVQAGILASARERLAEVADWAERRSIVLADAEWHAGVLGVVASKLAEEFHRPTILLSVDGDVARGSARSVAAVNIFEAVEACEKMLLSYGGHSGAAGVRLPLDRLDEFREHFERQVQAQFDGREPCEVVAVEAEVGLGAVGHGLVAELDRLAPYGQGNAAPVLACSDVSVAGQPQLMGRQGQHVSFYVRQGEVSLRVIGFGMGDVYEALSAGGAVCDVAFTPRVNTFRGMEEIELELCDLRFRQ